MDWTLEFDGSEVQVTELAEHQVRLRFSAALVHQRGEAGTDTGHVKGLELLFSQATWASADPALCLGALSGCSLVIDGLPHRLIPVPFESSGDVHAEFNFRSGTSLSLSARAVQCQAPEGARFTTSYAC